MLRANPYLGLKKKSPDRGAHPRKSRGFLLAGSLLIVLTLLSGCEKKAETEAGPPDVQVVEVVQRDVPVTAEWVATLTGLVNADIHAQVTGYLIKQNYTNGDFVKKGAPLFEIDPRPFQAALDQAKANLEQAQGTLKQNEAALEAAKANQLRAEASLGKTQIDVKRYTPLAKDNAISQEELDNAIQANLGAQAEVESMKASVLNATAAIGTAKAAIGAGKAAVDTAQLNLGFTNIVSPIDGVAGIANAQVGDLVGAQSATLTTVSTVSRFSPNSRLAKSSTSIQQKR